MYNTYPTSYVPMTSCPLVLYPDLPMTCLLSKRRRHESPKFHRAFSSSGLGTKTAVT